MKLIPVEISVIRNDSNTKQIPFQVNLTMEITFVGSGNFTDFQNPDGTISEDKIARSILNREIRIGSDS